MPTLREADEVTARHELYEMAEALHAADKKEKEGKLAKENARGPFFALISEVVRDEVPLARQTVTIETGDDFDIDAWRSQNYPEWRVVAINGIKGGMEIILEENEAFKKYEFNHQGFRFGRTIRMEGAGFDAEGFYGEITEGQAKLEWNDEKANPVLNDLLSCIEKKEVVTYSLDEKKMLAVMTEHPETVALFQSYMHPGVPKPALLPIKVAKEEQEEE